MASRIIHMAISAELQKVIDIMNTERFVLGHLLPDAIERSPVAHAKSHFKVNTLDNKKKLIDFNAFYNKFSHLIPADELYLGYYFHLIQDSLYRKLLFVDNNFATLYSDEFVKELHNDYAYINKYLINKYNLLELEYLIDEEDIYEVYPFKLTELYDEMIQDFTCQETGTPVHLTFELTDEYIEKAKELCKKEYNELVFGRCFVDPHQFAWERK